jgi:hypothetical protein
MNLAAWNKANSLDKLAAWLRSLPDDFPITDYNSIALDIWFHDHDTYLRAVEQMPKPYEKDATSTYFFVRHDFGAGVKLDLTTVRDEVCTAKPTGEVTERVTYEVPLEVKEQYKVVTTQPVMEWDCEPLKGRDDG